MFGKRRSQEDFDAEIQAHIKLEADRLREDGMPEDAALAKARRAFGNRTLAGERFYESSRWTWWGNLRQDFAYTCRSLRRNPGFTAVALLTLALGIGANTAIFSVINCVLLRPLSYHQPDRLFKIHEVVPLFSDRFPTLPANANHLAQWQQQCTAFEGLAEFGTQSFSLTGLGVPEQLSAEIVSWNYFQVLGVRPELGRGFLEEEDRPGNNHEAVLTYSLWRDRFSSARSIIGGTINLDGAPYVVIGVMPQWFRTPSPEQPQIFTPLGIDPKTFPSMGDFDYQAIGRLADGAAASQALAQLNLAQSRISDSLPDKIELRAAITPLKDTVVAAGRQGLLLLFTAVAMVLLVICVNLAGLLLSRASARAREVAIRTALGATRSRLLTQLLTESALLSLLGGAVGVPVAYWGLNALVRLAPPDTPRLSEIRLDWRALGFALVASAAVGLIVGALPALRLTKHRPGEALKSGGRTAGDSRHQARVRKVLIAAEIAISVALVSTTVLLVASFNRVLSVDKGFQTDHVLTMEVTLPAAKYSKRADMDRFYTQTISNLERLPGVASVGMISVLPLRGDEWSDCASPEGDHRPFPERPEADYRPVNGGYFRAMGIRLLGGRVFDQIDRGRQVAIISQSLSQSLWPGESSVGKHLTRCDPDERPFEVVGVVADVRGAGLALGPQLSVYVPYWYRVPPVAAFALRTSTISPQSMTTAAAAAIWQLDNEVPVSHVQTMEEIVSGSVAERRFQLGLLLAFAFSALMLAAVGIYGVVAESVVRRTNEIGIRMALGARRGEIIRMLLRDGLMPVTIGLSGGLAGTLAVGRVLKGLLFEISPSDPSALVGSMLVLIAVAAVACYIPARGATRVDPMSALRYE
jgi:predicted permease